jgi:hypothetical protein
MMKTKVIMLTATLLCARLLSAQNIYEQTLLDTLFQGKYADALDYYARHEDSIKNAAHYQTYKAITSAVLNKPDSAIAYLNILLNEYTYADSGGGAIAEDWYYDWLIRMYRNGGDQENVIKSFDRLTAKPRYRSRDASLLQGIRNFHQNSSLYPTMTLINTGVNEDIRIKIQAEEDIEFEAQYNKSHLKIRTVFDTGGSDVYFIMGHKTADSVGIKIADFDSVLMRMNYGNESNYVLGIVDSVRIGNLLIRNASVFISLVDTPLDSANDSTFVPMVVMGLPMIKKFNHVQLDMQNGEMIISLNKKEAATGRSNMFLNKADIYQRLLVSSSLNGVRFTAFFDTGFGKYSRDSIAILIGKDFYQNYSKAFPTLKDSNVDSTSVRLLGNKQNVKYIRVPESRLQIGDKLQIFHQDAVVLTEDSRFLIENDDGLIGFEALKRTSKVTLDFYNMRLELE